MGGSLYNKIPLGRRHTIFNLSRLQFAAGIATVLSAAALLLIIR